MRRTRRTIRLLAVSVLIMLPVMAADDMHTLQNQEQDQQQDLQQQDQQQDQQQQDQYPSLHPQRHRPQPKQHLVRFYLDEAAREQMYAVTNAVLDWRDLIMTPATGLRGYIQTNQTVAIGWRPITAKITTPENAGTITTPEITGPGVTSGMLYTYENILIEFSQPVAAVGLPAQFGYRFGWQVSMEALDAHGNSLGEIGDSGYTFAPYSPLVFLAAVADSDVIYAVRVSVPGSYMCPTGCLYAGMVQINDRAGEGEN